MGACGSKSQKLVSDVGDKFQHMSLNPFDSKGDVNSRNQNMLKESTELANKLKKGAKDLRALTAAAEAALDSSKAVLDFPQPNVYQADTAAGAACEPAQPTVTVGGAGYSGDQLAQAKADLAVKVQAEAFAPLDQWMAKYTDAMAKQKVVNKAFDEVASCRKKAEALRTKVQHLQASAGGDAKAASQLQEAQKALQVAEDKLNMATNKHTEEEAAQFARVSALNQEAASLAGTVRAALEQVGSALLQGRDAIPATAAAAAAPAAVPADAAVPAAMATAPPASAPAVEATAPVMEAASAPVAEAAKPVAQAMYPAVEP